MGQSSSPLYLLKFIHLTLFRPKMLWKRSRESDPREEWGRVKSDSYLRWPITPASQANFGKGRTMIFWRGWGGGGGGEFLSRQVIPFCVVVYAHNFFSGCSFLTILCVCANNLFRLFCFWINFFQNILPPLQKNNVPSLRLLWISNIHSFDN